MFCIESVVDTQSDERAPLATSAGGHTLPPSPGPPHTHRHTCHHDIDTPLSPSLGLHFLLGSRWTVSMTTKMQPSELSSIKLIHFFSPQNSVVFSQCRRLDDQTREVTMSALPLAPCSLLIHNQTLISLSFLIPCFYPSGHLTG